MVTVQVDNVNEAPQFSSDLYTASIFSIAPYKTSVISVKASDPDVGDEGLLVYSLSAGGSYFDVDPSSGLVYVVSAAALAEQTAAVEVTATDPHGLKATTRVVVEVRGSASSSNVVTISLNQPANIVDRKVPELEKSLGAALGWRVTILDVWQSEGGASESRALSTAVRTLVSFIAVDGEEVVSAEVVTEKLHSQSDVVRAELVKVFGEGFQYDVELKPQSPASDQAAIIALGVLLALSILGLIITTVLIVRFKRKEKHQAFDKETFDIDRNTESYRNGSLRPGTEQVWTRPQEVKPEAGQHKTDRQTAQWDRQTNSVKFREEINESHVISF
uniref:cadherin-related family member 1-like n=1 Tax=Monopterus albus TaxID=43700 RepID=UPI0009B3B2F9|nr:cadherin-related family member 1-like [Monopterus albus]